MRIIAGFLLLMVLILGAGCNSTGKLVDHVTFQPSANLEVVRVSLVFTNKVQSDFGIGFQVGKYGYVFLNPYTGSQPFEIGFDLDTSIVNDQKYVNLSPTTVLPNGVPIGLDHAVVEVRDENPISSKFDAFAYVDVLKASWLGAASIFNFLSDKNFPTGLSLTEVFWRDKAGNPGIFGSVFGPTLNPDGTLARAGGIALFANVRALIAEHKILPSQTATFRGEPAIELNGPKAPSYRGNVPALRELENNLIRGFNGAL